MKLAPPITWFGGKSRLATRIVAHFPEHHTYVEPFGGSAAVLLAKPLAKIEVYNDIDRDLVNLFQVLRDPELFPSLKHACENTCYSRAEFELALEPTTDPIESARRFIVRQRQSHGGIGHRWSYCISDHQCGMSSAVRRWISGIERLHAIHRRMRHVQVEADDWARIIERYDTPHTLFYLDPPYPPHTRVGGGYRHELSETDHHRLAETLLGIRGMSILSGYDCEAYRPLEMAGWTRQDYCVPAYMSPRRERRKECLWISPPALCATEKHSARDRMQLGARLTHRRRTQETEARILVAIDELRAQNTRVTISAVSRHLGISREHLSRRHRQLFSNT